MVTEAVARQRIDKWLFFARVVKSRSLAAKLAVGGKVRVNSQKIDQAAYQVKIGDVLTITLERHVVIYKVLTFGERRGPAPEARLLYEDMTPEPVSPMETIEALPPRRESGAGRPTKKERRETDRLRGN
ncbi:RNA-binding S4 domain-containing protein [Brucella gallinifaecis]|uniref:RNA-binding S4 domain-containing protein n=1 Tax=Brucella gallinifaecis TaxID=215590 RepID=A0A502BMA0_9HYPH|nr:RNA-binding S4 domain-containing protein [Brucella gallinifaecis]TPF74967.1 RNA-binding S4 domain-containing protein [Brucella gallinifaecis]